MKRSLAAVLAATVIAGSNAGCYGTFTLTKKLHGWNGTVTDNKFVNTLIFWALIIVPVYELITLGDAIIFNVIEFWTGSNIVADGTPPRMSTLADGTLIIERNGKRYELRSEGQFVILSQDGVRLGRAKLTEGGMVLEHEAVGQTVSLAPSEVPAEDADRLARAMAN